MPTSEHVRTRRRDSERLMVERGVILAGGSTVALTADQVRILMRLPRCRTHLVLAREMRMSLSTLKRHLDRIRAQLEVENDAGAVTEALRRSGV